MKLLFAIIQNEDNKALTRALIQHDISVTRISSTGGFLAGGNRTLMIGVAEEKLQETLDIIRETSRRRTTVTAPAMSIPHNTDSIAMPVNVVIGGATVFILNVEDPVKF